MGSRGVLFALTTELADRLLQAGDDHDVMEVIEDIEEAWDREHLVETDKGWDAIHRALTDGRLEWDNGEPHLNPVILGGRRQYEGDYIAVCKTVAEVAEVATALASISPDELSRRYLEIVSDDYAPENGEEDRAYTVDCYEGIEPFYRRAAGNGRAVLFTTDR